MFQRTHLAAVLAALTLALALARTSPSPAGGVVASTWPPTTPLAHPRHWVVIEESQPFVVPPGAVFIVTALGTPAKDSSNPIASLFADGALLVKTAFGFSGTLTTSLPSPDVPLAVPGGTTLTVSASTGVNLGRAWGYLLRPSAPQATAWEAPPPWEWFTIHEGAPYQVPTGKLLVVAALDYGGGIEATSLIVDGKPQVTAYATADWDANVRALPPGLAVAAGSLVEPRDLTGLPPASGTAWCFLVDAR